MAPRHPSARAQAQGPTAAAAAPFRVLVAVDSHNPTVYGTLAGIRRFERQTGRWELALPGGDFGQIDDYLRHWRPHGLIGMLQAGLIERARAHGIAAVSLVSTSPMPANLKVYNDPAPSARAVAEYFADRRLTHLRLYVGEHLTPAMRERAEAFERIAKRMDGTYGLFAPRRDGVPAHESGMVARIHQLTAWLRDQPRPIGLWAISDPCGWQAVQACRLAGLHVPDDVAVVGYKNEQTLCEFCEPPLSSLATDQPRMGYEAATLLDRLMRGQPPPEQPIRIPPLGVLERRSSDTIAVEDPVVRQAVRYIREQAGNGIGVEDVLDHVSVSASTLLRRFRHHLGRTPAQQIKRARLDIATRLLATTDQPLADIAATAGFDHLSQFCRDFKQAYRRTPTDYRVHLHRSGSRTPERHVKA